MTIVLARCQGPASVNRRSIDNGSIQPYGPLSDMQRLDLEDCFSDSPLVRLQINKAEQYIAELELKAKALAKASRASIDATNGIQTT